MDLLFARNVLKVYLNFPTASVLNVLQGNLTQMQTQILLLSVNLVQQNVNTASKNKVLLCVILAFKDMDLMNKASVRFAQQTAKSVIKAPFVINAS